MTVRLEQLSAQIRDDKIREIMSAGTTAAKSVHDIYTEGAMEVLAERILALEEEIESLRRNGWAKK